MLITATALVSTVRSGRRLAYTLTDGPHAGVTFFAADAESPQAPAPGTTVRVRFNPADQFAVTYPSTTQELLAAAVGAVSDVAAACFKAGGCDPENGLKIDGILAVHQERAAGVLESLGSFLASLAADDLKARSFPRVLGSLAGLVSCIATDLALATDTGLPLTKYAEDVATHHSDATGQPDHSCPKHGTDYCCGLCEREEDWILWLLQTNEGHEIGMTELQAQEIAADLARAGVTAPVSTPTRTEGE